MEVKNGSKKKKKKAVKRKAKKRVVKKRKKVVRKKKKKAVKRKAKKRVVKKKKVKKKKTKRKLNPALKKVLSASPALAAVVKSSKITRQKAIQQFWIYVKKHKLQDHRDRRNINLDATLKKLFGNKQQVNMFQATKVISKNLK